LTARVQKKIPMIPRTVGRAMDRLVLFHTMMGRSAITVALLGLATAFLSASGHAVCGFTTPLPDGGYGTLPAMQSTESKPVLPARQESESSGQPAPPPDRIEARVPEIDAIEKESFEIARTLLRDLPGNSDALGVLGMVHNRHGHTVKALECWEQALRGNPQRANLYDAMATVALRKGEYERAVEYCRKGLATSIPMPHLHYQLAEALNGLGRAEESATALRKAIRQFPDRGELRIQLGKTYLLLSEHGKAKISYEIAVKLQPNSAAAHYGLAHVCMDLGLDDESQREMEEFKKLKAQSEPILKNAMDGADDVVRCRRSLAMTCSDAATVYIDNGKPDKAEPLLRRGAESDPQSIGCRIQLEELLFSADRLPEAIPIVWELIEIEPYDALFHLRLAMLYAQLECLDEARGAAREAMELAPHNEECRRFLEQLQENR
jgi:protein O-GlcNAc transferase